MTEHTEPVSYLLRCSPQKELLPIDVAKGHYLITQDGREIFDASGGAGVSCLGPGPNESIEQSIQVQRNKVTYLNHQCFTTPVAEALSQRLVAEPTGAFSKAVLLSSGSAVTEAAAKLITQYWRRKDQPERRIILSRNPSYHGSTYKALSLSGYPAHREPFEDSLSQHTRLSACDSYRGKKGEESDADYVGRLKKDLESEIESTGPGNIAGLILEPVAGAALGAMPYVSGYLRAILDVCKKYSILSLFDECMSGMYRTGNLYAWMRDGAAPDVLTLGKCLAGGFEQLSAILMSKEIADVIEKDGGYFNHGQTFQNWAPACAGALDFMKQIREKDLVKNISNQGNKLMRLLRASLDSHPHVGDIRGEGLMIGIEFVKVKASKELFGPNDDVARELRNKGLQAPYNTQVYSSNCDGRNFLMLLPPYTITDEEVQNLVGTMERLIYDFFEARKLVASSAEGGMEASTAEPARLPGIIAETVRVDRRYIGECPYFFDAR
ncbi:pyridoxal phosphate-dependent transferase [Phaeosphaeriaceae sp. PMI808]|nr:pyridoxal phosphate-dependent transferase [Phaeosphaeriaceae sp. PMI808]